MAPPSPRDRYRIIGRKRSRFDQHSNISHSTMNDRSLLTEESTQHALLEQYLNRDQLFKAALVAAEDWQTAHLSENGSKFDQFLNSHGFDIEHRGHPKAFADAGDDLREIEMLASREHPLTIQLPQLKRQSISSKPLELRISKKDRALQSEQIDELVPVRLDIEWDQIRLRDTFTWNMHDRVVGVDLFAHQLIEDFKLGLANPQSEPLIRQISSSIQEQINDFHPHIYIEEDALDPHLPYSAYKNDEMRIVIKLNITIGQHTLEDQFEWDINNPLNSPEEFAASMSRELSLSGEFTTAIAHSIREQSQLYTQSLYVVGHPFDGRPIEDHELLASFQPSPLQSAFRPYQAAKEFTPWLYELNDAELEKTELSMSREERRQKRSVNRRGGPTLPDLKDRRRTIRTLLVSSVLPGAVSSIHDSRIYKRPAGVGKPRKGAMRDGFDEFDDSDSDESVLGSPAASTHPYAGTARTRGIRGAASAAQAAMRANLGRSATPESITLHHHETRASGRRVIRDDSTPEPQGGLVVTLRLPPSTLRRLQDTHSRSTDVTPAEASAVPRHDIYGSSHNLQSAMGPPPSIAQPHLMSSPNPASGFRSQALSAAMASNHSPLAHLGRLDATGPHNQDHPIVRPGVGAQFMQ